MSYESRAYDNEHGDPVVVLVTTGTHDVSRLVNLLAGNRMALCEHMTVSERILRQVPERILRQVRRHNGGRAALELLAAHGGPDLRDADDDERATMRSLLDILSSDEPCSLDEHGGCNEHGWSHHQGPACPHGRVQALLDPSAAEAVAR